MPLTYHSELSSDVSALINYLLPAISGITVNVVLFVMAPGTSQPCPSAMHTEPATLSASHILQSRETAISWTVTRLDGEGIDSRDKCC